MRSYRTWLVLTALVAGVVGCNGEMVRVPTTSGSSDREWREPADPDLFTMRVAALQYDVDRPVGYAEARQRPLSGFPMNARIRWNACVDTLSRYYTALCAAHNEGRLAIDEFGSLTGDAESGLRMLSDLRPEFDAALEAYETAAARLPPRPAVPPGWLKRQVAQEMDASRRAAEDVLERAGGVAGRFAEDPWPVEPIP
jgi:hypothetical protein